MLSYLRLAWTAARCTWRSSISHPGQTEALRRYENLALPVFHRHRAQFRANSEAVKALLLRVDDVPLEGYFNRG